MLGCSLACGKVACSFPSADSPCHLWGLFGSEQIGALNFAFARRLSKVMEPLTSILLPASTPPPEVPAAQSSVEKAREAGKRYMRRLNVSLVLVHLQQSRQSHIHQKATGPHKFRNLETTPAKKCTKDRHEKDKGKKCRERYGLFIFEGNYTCCRKAPERTLLSTAPGSECCRQLAASSDRLGARRPRHRAWRCRNGENPSCPSASPRSS